MQQFRIFRALGLSFKVWFKNFVPFTLLAAVLYAPVVLWVLYYDPTNADSADTVLNSYFVAPMYLVTAVATLLPPLITYRVVQDMNGVRVSLGTSMKFGVRGILPAVLFAIFTHLISYVPGAGGIISAIMSCVWFVVTPVAVAERTGPMESFTRSSVLTKGRRWGIFGLSLLVGVAVFGLLFVWVIPMFEHGGEDAAVVLSQARSAAIMFVLTLGVFQLFTGIVQAVSYVLLREDKDGVTAQELAKIFE